jgi:HlyD family secretion protein
VLFQIATDLTKMKVECSVDESDIGKVKEGQKVRFTVEAYPNDTFNGIVQQVRFSPETVQNVVTYTTIVNVENPEKKLLPGMTATVSIIVGEAKNVLRVPNGALRFTPNLSPEDLEKLMTEMRDKLMAQRQAQGGQPGAPAGAPAEGGARPQGQGGAAAFQRLGGAGAGGEGQAGRTRQQMPRIWLLGEDGKLSPVMVRTGVSDTSYTEIVRAMGAELKEGDIAVVGTLTATSSSTNRGMNQMMFMGGPPGGGRR